MGRRCPMEPPQGERVVLQEKAGRAAAAPAGVVILRGAVQVVGELLITAGIILLLFVAWQLWWTNVESDARQSAVIKEFAQDLGGAAPAAPAPDASAPDAGEDFGEVLQAYHGFPGLSVFLSCGFVSHGYLARS